jgi:hypothetical protein
MSTKLRSKMQQQNYDAAVEDATRWMDQAIRNIESQVTDLKRQRERFIDIAHGDGKSMATPVDALSWFVGSAMQVPGQCPPRPRAGPRCRPDQDPLRRPHPC